MAKWFSLTDSGRAPGRGAILPGMFLVMYTLRFRLLLMVGSLLRPRFGQGPSHDARCGVLTADVLDVIDPRARLEERGRMNIHESHPGAGAGGGPNVGEQQRSGDA